MKQFITIILAVLMFMTVSCAGKTSADELFDEDLGAVDKIGHGTAILSILQHGSSPDAEYLSIMKIPRVSVKNRKGKTKYKAGCFSFGKHSALNNVIYNFLRCESFSIAEKFMII